MVLPLLFCLVSARKRFLCSLQNKPQRQNPPGLGDTGLLSCPGDTLGHGGVLRGHRTLLRALVSILSTLDSPAQAAALRDAGEGMHSHLQPLWSRNAGSCPKSKPQQAEE